MLARLQAHCVDTGWQVFGNREREIVLPAEVVDVVLVEMDRAVMLGRVAPALLAAFFWKRVTRIAGVASIASGMFTVITIAALNAVYKDSAEPLQIFGASFPMDTDYIAIPAVIVSVSTLVIVSLATRRPEKADWQEFIDEPT